MGMLSGKISLVTGGGRGIGRAIALALAEAGSDVGVNYLQHAAPAEEVCDQIRALGRRARAYKANIANDDENHEMVRRIQEDLGVVQVLVNNAGITRDKTFVKMTYEIWKEVLDVDLTGPAMVTHALLPGMIERNWGRVIFMTSVIGQMGNFGQTNYSVAKGGLIALTKSLARETAKKGVTVNAIAPGFIRTDILKDMPPEALQKIVAQTAVGRLGEPDEVAEAVLFLASPKAGYVTGSVINVNGGLYM
ncbi:MAG: 3-oxoacyl-ACP reductase [Phycisphaerae bacterium]|nr:3-oxoacyl-ACP reductase [Phycisphaerae bacterium]NUQ45729.1 3-oxoacyl-ACP reductase [Phycisphaerae bacterium]